MAKTLDEYVKEVHGTAKEKGWWDQPRPDLECHMLMVSEIAEATEEYRNRKPAIYQPVNEYYGVNSTPESTSWDKNKKPEGEAIELADCVIRIMDYFGSKGWSLEQAVSLKCAYNETRPYRHGGKKA